MVDIILIAVIVAVIGGASWKLYEDKKKGKKCAGCPYADVASNTCHLEK